MPVREKSKPHGRQSQIRFGKRLVKGKIKKYCIEQHVIKVVKEMGTQGLSLRQIAKNMSYMKIPTKENGRKWHPQMIKRILQS